jgi:hypothetical protein
MTDLDTMHVSDIAAGLALCRKSGWNQMSRDWEYFLKHSPKDCLVARSNDKVVGTVTCLRFQQAFSWISMVLVDPACRGRGIGTFLLEQALHLLEQEETVKLDATPEGRKVYVKFDFRDEYPLLRMVCSSFHSVDYISAVKPILAEDMERIKKYDREIFGADRGTLLDWIYERATELAFYVGTDENEIGGYCLGRYGFLFVHIGPVVAENDAMARALVTAALSHCGGKAGLDIFPEKSAWTDWLCSMGFTERRSFTRMYRGKNLFPGVIQKQFAITGPEFG